MRTPSGLFPSGRPRPTYRERHPARAGAVGVGAAVATTWLVLFGFLGGGLRGYLWWTVLAGVAAWLAALILARRGDRGVAAGVAVIAGGGLAVAAAVAAWQWAASGDWPLW